MIVPILASAVASANKASSIVRNILESGNLQIVEKGLNDFQTLADRDAQRCIVDTLEHKFPGLKVIGEEGALEKANSVICEDQDPEVLKHECPDEFKNISMEDIVVWVDPLDGTREFTEGLVHHVTVLIGIAVKGVPTAGVICQPFYSKELTLKDLTDNPSGVLSVEDIISKTTTRTIWGLKGIGMYGLVSNKISPASIVNSGYNENIIVTTRSHLNESVVAAINACCPSKILKMGGCGYKVLMLLEGYVHAYIYASPGCKRWDTCAPEALLLATGGILLDLRGNPYRYNSDVEFLNKTGVFATPNADWTTAYLEKIPTQLKSSL